MPTREARYRRAVRRTGLIVPIRDSAGVRIEPLAEGTLALWVRANGQDRFIVADSVPAVEVAGVVRHLREHATPAVAEALGLVVCEMSTCTVARARLAVSEAVDPASSA